MPENNIQLYELKTIAKYKNNAVLLLRQTLNFYLIWNKGIAFGLFSLDEKIFYNYSDLILDKKEPNVVEYNDQEPLLY